MSLAHVFAVLLASVGGEPAGEVIDFSATYCGPCRSMAPVVARLEREGLPIRTVDIEQHSDLAEQFNITKIPTFVLVINGSEAHRVVGPMSEADLRRMCARIPAPSAAQPEVLAINNPQSRRGVTQPLGTVTPPAERKQNPILGMLGIGGRDQQEQEFRGNDTALGPAGQAAPPTNDPMHSSVRIRASIKGQISLGSGTVVASQPGRTLIVTCGHIFRDRDDSTKVEVDLFENGRSQTYVATIIDFDLPSDVGLVSIPTHSVVSSTPVAPAELKLERAQSVACVGCSGGNDPTREQLYITEVNKYDGPDNIECTGTPVQGRSGGGLFNADGQLIGVCIAAVEDASLGVYAHVFAVHQLMDRNNLSSLYRPESPPAEAVLADAATDSDIPAEFPEQFADETALEPAAAPVATTPVSVAATTSEGVPTDLAGVMADVSAGDAEVVVIIRSRSNPNAESRVVIINRASPKFLAYLNGEIRPEGLAANRPARQRPFASRAPRRGATAQAPTVESETQPVTFQPPRSTPPRSGNRALSRQMAEAGR
ncbi:MAG: trypsin-like peptidase domain-containing protein [Planctomycetaceae bacterium]|nr:trypsin-like peptidase domain-containing protein [Planctomycetaceae bacterium]